ncbi:hypothetical protein ACJJTC_015733 [Scirpophaga incertulas]
MTRVPSLLAGRPRCEEQGVGGASLHEPCSQLARPDSKYSYNSCDSVENKVFKMIPEPHMGIVKSKAVAHTYVWVGRDRAAIEVAGQVCMCTSTPLTTVPVLATARLNEASSGLYVV